MSRAGVCASPVGANQMFGKLMPDSHTEGEFGPPLYENDGKPLDVEPTCVETPADGSKTIFEIVDNACRRNATRPAVGVRKLVKVHSETVNGRTFEKLEVENNYTFMNYTQFNERLTNFASGMRGLQDLQPKQRVVIYAETAMDWLTSACACFSQSLEIVTIYATLGEEGALYGINQTKSTIVIADPKLLKVLAKIAPQCPSMQHVITMGDVDEALAKKVRDTGKTVTSFEEVVKKGAETPVAPRPPTPDDVAVVMYTSGTTGAPKGVLLTHKNIVAACAGFQISGGRYGLSPETAYLAYLPLAHIMEMISEISMLMFGAQLGYGSPHTLTETGVKLKRPESEGDAIVLRPTFMVFAPAVFDKVYKSVTGKVAASGGLKKSIFNMAMNAGMRSYDNGGVGVNSFVNGIAFSAVQKMLGGRINTAVTGSAPLAPEIQRFMQTVLKAPVRQGYGLTENCACATLGAKEDNMVKSVGAPHSCSVIRLADWPEGLYMNSDKTRPDVGMARGEVLVGGPAVCMGYFVDPDSPDPDVVKKNEEEFLTIKGVRYFRTGDIGQITTLGTIQIIDRKKDLWKGPQGEYVALSKVESAVKMSPYVDIPMVYGKTGGEYPVCLICVVDREVSKWAAANGCPTSGTEMVKNQKVIDEVLRSVKDECKKVGLVEFEIPKKVALLAMVDGAAPWTPENDMLTAAMKLKRPQIARAHAAEIDAIC